MFIFMFIYGFYCLIKFKFIKKLIKNWKVVVHHIADVTVQNEKNQSDRMYINLVLYVIQDA